MWERFEERAEVGTYANPGEAVKLPNPSELDVGYRDFEGNLQPNGSRDTTTDTAREMIFGSISFVELCVRWLATDRVEPTDNCGPVCCLRTDCIQMTQSGDNPHSDDITGCDRGSIIVCRVLYRDANVDVAVDKQQRSAEWQLTHGRSCAVCARSIHRVHSHELPRSVFSQSLSLCPSNVGNRRQSYNGVQARSGQEGKLAAHGVSYADQWTMDPDLRGVFANKTDGSLDVVDRCGPSAPGSHAPILDIRNGPSPLNQILAKRVHQGQIEFWPPVSAMYKDGSALRTRSSGRQHFYDLLAGRPVTQNHGLPTSIDIQLANFASARAYDARFDRCALQGSQVRAPRLGARDRAWRQEVDVVQC